MSFVWFWTFWHWSKESFRDGSLLRSPLHGIGGHWDEWFRHEASESDRHSVEQIGRTETSQRQFIGWLLRRWARETDLRGNRSARHFVLGQLAQVQPFNKWPAFEKYRTSYRVGGVPAIVLAEKSLGEAEDVRAVEALTLPADSTAPTVIAEGFQADCIELETPRHAAMSLLRGKGFRFFLALWIAGGQRPYPQWLKAVLGLGWFVVGGLILYLVAGPEPGQKLFLLSMTLVALWSGLIMIGVTVIATQSFLAWRQGRIWHAKLEESQVRLRMKGGLTLKGGSAGLPFCLNTLLALYHDDVRSARSSWIWRRLFHKLHYDAEAWAATGVITADGYLKPVILEAKLRACLQRGDIRHILTPRQPGMVPKAVNRLANDLTPRHGDQATAPQSHSGVQLGFAAEELFLRIHPCRHISQVLMRVGEFTNTRQMALNVFAITVSVAMLFALPDLRAILRPPPAPEAVAPSSPSPSHLWVSLDTEHPDDFQVVLESSFWANRRARVVRYGGADASVRAEILLHRLASQNFGDGEDGTVWVERRRHFLHREYAPGERVGNYSISYLNHLPHE